METKDSYLYITLKNYYNLLSKTGYCNIETVKKLIVLDFIDSFVNDYSVYITEDILKVLNKAIKCCNRDCPIDYPIIQDSILHKIYKDTDINSNIDVISRVTEDNNLRILEEDEYRIKE